MKAKKYTKETILNIGMTDRGFPTFKVGDTIGVVQKIKEGDKERLQLFQGDVIAMKNKGIASCFVVRKIGAGGVSIERIFPFYTPMIESITLVRHGRVRRAKLYYLRNREGRAARIPEKIVSRAKKQKNEIAQ